MIRFYYEVVCIVPSFDVSLGGHNPWRTYPPPPPISWTLAYNIRQCSITGKSKFKLKNTPIAPLSSY